MHGQRKTLRRSRQGAPNIADFLPAAESIVDYRALGSPAALRRELLRLGGNEAAWNAKVPPVARSAGRAHASISNWVSARPLLGVALERRSPHQAWRVTTSDGSMSSPGLDLLEICC